MKPRMKLDAEFKFANGRTKTAKLLCRIDTADELDYFPMAASCITCCANWSPPDRAVSRK